MARDGPGVPFDGADHAARVERYRPAPLEILAGTLLGDDPGVAPLGARPQGVQPLAALEAAMLPALLRPPCLVSFSGGRDSSVILAAGTSLARREGLAPPVPVTLRFPHVEETREDDWQEMVVRHLGLRDWAQLAFGDELDALGPVAGAALRRFGVLAPFNWYLHRPMLERAAGGSLLTGVGGDELFGSPGSLTLRLGAGRRRGLPRRLARAGLLAAPRPLRRRVERGRPGAGYAWLRPPAAAAVRAALARDAVAEPLRWDLALRRWWRSRGFQAQRHVLGALGADLGVLTVHPFLDAGFLAELAPLGGVKGFADRSVAIERLFGGLLPEAVVHRRTKATFGPVCFGPTARAFVSTWDGSGIDAGTVDRDAVGAEWTSARPDARSVMLLQSAWLATTGRGPTR